MLLGCHVALATKRPLQSAALADGSEAVPTRWYRDTTAKAYVIGTLALSRLVTGREGVRGQALSESSGAASSCSSSTRSMASVRESRMSCAGMPWAK